MFGAASALTSTKVSSEQTWAAAAATAAALVPGGAAAATCLSRVARLRRRSSGDGGSAVPNPRALSRLDFCSAAHSSAGSAATGSPWTNPAARPVKLTCGGGRAAASPTHGTQHAACSRRTQLAGPRSSSAAPACPGGK